MIRIILLLLLGLLLFSPSAHAQNPVITQPYVVTSSNASSTISVTNTFQSIWVADTTITGRVACTIQNNGSNSMWVFFGPITSATKGASVVLAAGDRVYCGINGVILHDQVSITGTSGDAFYAAKQ
jgi:hypothetical protein